MHDLFLRTKFIIKHACMSQGMGHQLWHYLGLVSDTHVNNIVSLASRRTLPGQLTGQLAVQ